MFRTLNVICRSQRCTFRGGWFMRNSRITISVFALAWIGVTSQNVTAADVLDFDRQIAPILARHCLDCHSGSDPKGGLDLSRRELAMRGGLSGEVILSGKPEESLLWEYIAEGTMPPKTTLPEDEARLLRAWIEAGAQMGKRSHRSLSGYDKPACRPRLVVLPIDRTPEGADRRKRVKRPVQSIASSRRSGRRRASPPLPRPIDEP